MPHHGEAIIAISKANDEQFSVSFHYDGVEPWDVFRGAVALVTMVAHHCKVTPERVLEDIGEYIADGAVGQIREEPRRDN